MARRRDEEREVPRVWEYREACVNVALAIMILALIAVVTWGIVKTFF